MKGIDEYGFVTDINLAKRIIREKFTGWPYTYHPEDISVIGKENNLKEWLNKVETSLEEFDGGFSILRDNKHYDLGGTDGWSGFLIQEISKFFEDEWFIDTNPNEEVLCTIYDNEEDKYITFVLHELD